MPWEFKHLMLLVLFGPHVFSAGFQKFDRKKSIVCSQALTPCSISDINSVVLPDDSRSVQVSELNATAGLCCSMGQKCVTCVRVEIQIDVWAGKDEADKQESGDFDQEDEAAITISYSFGQNNLYKRIKFAMNAASSVNKSGEGAKVVEVILTEDQNTFMYSSVNISVQTVTKEVNFRIKDVCRDAELAECKNSRPSQEAPSIVVDETDKSNGFLKLKVLEEENQSDTPMICIKLQPHGQCLDLRNWTLPLHVVTPCMCFQAWSRSSMYRSEVCPFKNHSEFMTNVISTITLTVRYFETNEGRLALGWDLSAPCRVQAELWLCRLDSVECKEVPGFRTKSNITSVWKENWTTLSISGTFANICSRDPRHHCVMYKVDEKIFGPVCSYTTSRWRWSRIALPVLVVFILAVVGAFLLWRKVKACLSNSDPMYYTQGRCGTALLIHSSGFDSSQSDLVFRFAEMLSELGVSVSLDLKDQKTVSTVGPTPWLHSQLQHIQLHGGKALLLLSHDALHQTKECWDDWNAQKTAEKVIGQSSKMGLHWSLDVFRSALNCIIHAHLKGGADKHYALLQFDSKKIDMPEPLQDLRLYNLPSDSKDLLADLQTGHRNSIGSQLKRFLWVCRASARLKKGLIDYKEKRSASKSTYAGVKPLNMEPKQEEEETIPLQNEP